MAKGICMAVVGLFLLWSAASGELVPLSNLVSFERDVEPSKRTQFQQLNSLTVEGIMTPGVSLGDALAYLDKGGDHLPSMWHDLQASRRTEIDAKLERIDRRQRVVRNSNRQAGFFP
mgnify:CR=1 FL=1